MSYWDTSCLVKLYTPETDSELVRNHLASGSTCVTSDVAELEFWATVRRKESEGVLAAGEAAKVQGALDADIATRRIVIVPTDDVVRSHYRVFVDHCHGQTPPIHIRTNDAVHLAAARTAGEFEIVATDKRLRDAALALGFTVFPDR